MVKYALISLSPLAFIRRVDAPARTKAGYAIVPAVDGERPAFDPATHRLESIVTVTEMEVTRGWQAVPLTQQEIAAAALEAAHATSGGDKEKWIAALENGTANAAQTRRALAWVLRELTGLR